jgi:hypothetical protein
MDSIDRLRSLASFASPIQNMMQSKGATVMNLDSERLKDPLVVRWALDRIKYAREIENQTQLHEFSLLFNERMLRQIIERGDRNLVAALFMNIPTDWFASIRSYLIEGWLSWKGSVAYWAAMRIAELAPRDFGAVLAGLAESPGILLDETKLTGAFHATACIGKGATDL